MWEWGQHIGDRKKEGEILKGKRREDQEEEERKAREGGRGGGGDDDDEVDIASFLA